MPSSSQKAAVFFPLLCFLVLTFQSYASAQSYRALYTFAGGTDGSEPNGNLVFDSAGNLYGTTNYGGDMSCNNTVGGCGIVFKLAPNSDGTWKKTTVHSFYGNSMPHGYDGAFPNGGLVVDSSGNLYGTTTWGGHYGYGTVFELSPSAKGWEETILYNFMAEDDGAEPVAGVFLAPDGNIFGTAGVGGKKWGSCYGDGCGTVFEMTPTSSGQWIFTTLHKFLGAPQDGSVPYGLTADTNGNLFGMTTFGGPGFCESGCGTVFEVLLNSSGEWEERVLHDFGQGDGWNPEAGLTYDGVGGFYGAVALGGQAKNGVAVKLALDQGGEYAESIIYTFLGADHDDPGPTGSLLMDSQGNLYGVGAGWNSGVTNGQIYELSPEWSKTTLYAFTGHADGADPTGGLIWDKDGNLYGAAGGGGDKIGYFGDGVIFELTP